MSASHRAGGALCHWWGLWISIISSLTRVCSTDTQTHNGMGLWSIPTCSSLPKGKVGEMLLKELKKPQRNWNSILGAGGQGPVSSVAVDPPSSSYQIPSRFSLSAEVSRDQQDPGALCLQPAHSCTQDITGHVPISSGLWCAVNNRHGDM